jgi:GDP/UDP-N,N'-diacetylbacillosamine 2-epimerase (hydrolysing)
MTRHAIGKLVHLHFAANQDAADRLIKLGEEAFRVHNVGAPQLDEMVNAQFTLLSDIEDKLCVRLRDGYIWVLCILLRKKQIKRRHRPKYL